jgi:hypothetical protein
MKHAISLFSFFLAASPLGDAFPWSGISRTKSLYFSRAGLRSVSSSYHSSTALSAVTSEKKKVFIDGEAGTTGLQVRQRLEGREDLELLSPPPELRKDIETRRSFMNRADAVILCLPDAAAIEAVSLVTNPNTVLIDASTAFRTNDAWTYGFPGRYSAFLSNFVSFFCDSTAKFGVYIYFCFVVSVRNVSEPTSSHCLK